MAYLIADCHVSLLLIAPCLNNPVTALMLLVFRLFDTTFKTYCAPCQGCHSILAFVCFHFVWLQISRLLRCFGLFAFAFGLIVSFCCLRIILTKLLFVCIFYPNNFISGPLQTINFILHFPRLANSISRRPIDNPINNLFAKWSFCITFNLHVIRSHSQDN